MTNRKNFEALDLAEEEWRPVVGFEDRYEVSSLGSLRRKGGTRLSSNCVTGAGYRKADFYKGGRRTQTSIHRVVAEAFHGPSEGREVNHLNGIKHDNRAVNLEWATRASNMNHSRFTLGNDVMAIVATDAEIGDSVVFPSIETAVRYGFLSGCIYDCLNGKRKTHGGKIWSRPAPKADAANWTDADLCRMWKAAGGSFHGPHIETGTMPESKLLPFLRSLAAAPARGGEGEKVPHYSEVGCIIANGVCIREPCPNHAAAPPAGEVMDGELDRIRSAMTDFIQEHAGTKEAAATEFWLRQLGV